MKFVVTDKVYHALRLAFCSLWLFRGYSAAIRQHHTGLDDGISVWGAGPGESSRIGFLHLAEGSRGRRAGSTSELLFLGVLEMRRVCAGHRSTKPLPATILARQGLSNLYLRPLETKGFSSQRATNLKQIRLKSGYAPGYAPYIFRFSDTHVTRYAPRYAPYINIKKY